MWGDNSACDPVPAPRAVLRVVLDGKGQGAKSTSAGGDGEGCTLEGFLAEVILKWRPEGSIGISQEGKEEEEQHRAQQVLRQEARSSVKHPGNCKYLKMIRIWSVQG